MAAAPSDRRVIIAEALHKIDVLTARLEINHPAISLLAAYSAELLAPQEETEGLMRDSAGSVPDTLFDSVESTSAGGESGIS
jgi:hypothetical protein